MKLKLFLKQYYWYLRTTAEIKKIIVKINPDMGEAVKKFFGGEKNG